MAGYEERVTARAGWIVAKALEILEKRVLCDRCLGRLFAMLGRGVSNVERGRALKLTLVMTLHSMYRDGDEEAKRVLERLSSSLYGVSPLLYKEMGIAEPKTVCWLCGGVFDSFVDRMVSAIMDILREYDATRFLVGVRLSEDIRRREEELVVMHGLRYAESLSAELKREIGRRVRDQGYTPDFNNPEVVVLVEYPIGIVNVTVNPVLIAGRYKKTARRISQSSWITRSGVKRYPFSVQDAYTPLLELYKGVEIVIHAAGREDVDVRMLGSGRPIVVEIKEPKRRRIDVEHAERIVNERWRGLFETRLESYVTRSFVRGIVKGVEGEERHSKIYRAVVYVPEGVTPDDLRRLEEFFKNRLVRQRTPKRVRHRRADIVRERRVYRVATSMIDDYVFVALIHAEGGLYIKELVAGEDTWPGFPDALGKQSYCVELDVVHVESKLRLKKGLAAATRSGG